MKISPNYDHPVIHVADASRSVYVVSSLLDPNAKQEYAAEIADEYTEVREEHYASLRERKYAHPPTPHTLIAHTRPHTLTRTRTRAHDIGIRAWRWRARRSRW